MKILKAVEEARRSGDVGLLISVVPYARYLDLSAEPVAERLVTRLPFRPENLGNPDIPALHGGVVGGFLELTAAFELLWTKETGALPKTINITLDYLRPAGPVDTFATGTITKLGRRVANVQVTAWQDSEQRPVAEGYVHFLVSPT